MERQTQYHPRGFTLVELLVVIGIIATLAAIGTAVIGNVMGNARDKATRATINKVNDLITARRRAFDIGIQGRDFVQEVKIQYGNAPDGPLRLVKVKYRAIFPQTLAELQNYDRPLYDRFVSGYNSSQHDQLTESSEVLYWVMTEGQVFGSPQEGTDNFKTGEVKDTDGDGRMEFVDGWGEPLRFYRWPTRLLRPADTSDLATPNTNITRELINILMTTVDVKTLDKDPDDQLDDTQSATWFNEDDFHTRLTYHVPIVVSAGADMELGLYEPYETSNYGHLAQPNVDSPYGDSAIADNVTNLQIP